MSSHWKLFAILPFVALLLPQRSSCQEQRASNGVQFAPPIVLYYPASYPLAIASGDFNGDGIPDLVAGDEFGGGRIKRGKGDGTFEHWIPGPGSDYTTAIAVGNFDGNNRSDTVVNSHAGAWVGVQAGAFFLDADGNFVTGFALGDFNGDGKQDIAALVDIPLQNSDSSRVYLYLGNGDGTFRRPMRLRVPLTPIAILAGDFNGDGKLDLAVLTWRIHNGAGRVSVLLGDGHGGFGPALVHRIHRLQFSTAITLGDFNGDKKLDLAFTDADYYSKSGYTVRILLGNGDGSFREGWRGREGQVAAIASADFNGDGIADLVATKSCRDGSGSYSCISVLLGNGDGTFQPGIHFRAHASDPQPLAIADFNRDGKPDVATIDGNSGRISVLLNTTPFPVPKAQPPTGRQR